MATKISLLFGGGRWIQAGQARDEKNLNGHVPNKVCMSINLISCNKKMQQLILNTLEKKPKRLLMEIFRTKTMLENNLNCKEVAMNVEKKVYI